MASTSRHIPARARGLAVLLGLALPAIGQTLSFSSISSQCVNPSGFETCWANVTSTAQTCFGVVNRCSGSGTCTSETSCSSTRPACSSDCVCDAYAGWLNCALTSCWNKVYSCEYQNLAMHAHENCPGAGVGPKNTDDVDGYIPFTPAPAGAPGGCSCDVSFVYYRHYTSTANGRACVARPENRSTDAVHCRCCAASEAVSAFYNTCPTTDPLAVPLFDVTLEDSVALLKTAECRAALAGGFNCRTIGFQKPGIAGGSFYDAGSLPANGTATLSNTGNAITSPVAGPTLTWRLGERFGEMTAVAATTTGSSSPSGTAGSRSTGGSNSTNDAFSVHGSAPGGVKQLVVVFGMVAVGMAML